MKRKEEVTMRHGFKAALSPSVAVAAMFCLLARGARADGFEVKVEPAAAAALGDPQTDMFPKGGGLSVMGMVGIGRYVDAIGGVSFVDLPAGSDEMSMDSGTAWTFGGGVRIKRPHDELRFDGVSPWIDANALLVRTGSLDRFGFSIGAGISVPVDHERRFWVGPFVRYFQIDDPFRSAYDTRDLKVVLAGLSLEVGTSPMPRVAWHPARSPWPSPSPRRNRWSCRRPS